MTSQFKNGYERLVAELGLEGARAEMVRRRSLVKEKPKGGAFRDKQFAKAMSLKAAEARKAKHAEAGNTGRHAE